MLNLRLALMGSIRLPAVGMDSQNAVQGTCLTIELQPPDWQGVKIILRQNGQVVFRPELLMRATQALQARVAEHPVVICSQKGLSPAQILTEEVGPWRNARLVAMFEHYTAEMVIKRRTRKATVVFAPAPVPAAES